jgi:hypothetical protein
MRRNNGLICCAFGDAANTLDVLWPLGPVSLFLQAKEGLLLAKMLQILSYKSCVEFFFKDTSWIDVLVS